MDKHKCLINDFKITVATSQVSLNYLTLIETSGSNKISILILILINFACNER